MQPTDTPNPPATASQEHDRERTFQEMADGPAPSFLAEFVDFLRHNRKWWVTPLLLVLLLLSGLILLTNTAVGPFIYVLF